MADEKPDSGDLTIADILELWGPDEQRDRKNKDLAYKALEFYAADPESLSMWDADALEVRKGRPTLQIPLLPQYLNQVVNDMRLSKPAIIAIPVGSGADVDTAETYNSLIRYIENRSDAQAAYFNAADSQVVAGIGHWKVITEYADGTTFDQEIRVVPIDDGVGIVWDCDSTLPTREDAKRCWEPVDMSTKAFERLYPDHSLSGWDSTGCPAGWYSDDSVRVCRLWIKRPIKRTLALLPEGIVIDLTDKEPQEVAAVQMAVDEAMQMGLPARIEKRDGEEVVSYLVSAKEIIEGPTKWPGRYIPIVPILGREVKIGRKIVRKGMVLDAMDSQRMLNYAISADVEMTALQPKAPFIVTDDQVKPFEAEWDKANTANLPYLRYRHKDGVPMPQRSTPPVASAALAAQISMFSGTIQSVLGIFSANIGAPSNETSGKAIQARQREGDVGSYQFMNNFERGIAYTGRILVDLIPHIYDSERVIRIMGEDGKIDTVEINKAKTVDGVIQNIENDLTVGSYDVVLKAGPAFSTRREEMREGMQTLMQNKEIGALLADLFAEAQDWPLAKQIGERLEILLPPEIRAKRLAERGEQLPPPPPPPPPDPKQVLDVKKAELEVEGKELDNKAKELDLALQVATVAPAIDPAQIEQRFMTIEQVMQQIAAFIDGQNGGPPQPPPAEVMPPPPDIPPGMEPMAPQPPIEEQPPQPGGFFNGQ